MSADKLTAMARSHLRALSWVLVAALGISSTGCDPGGDAKEVEAIDASADGRALDFALIDHTGKQRRLSDFRGKVVAVFFGYTQCPDVCPTTLAEFVQVHRRLGPKADKLQVLFITVDPERDTQQLLAEYMPAFDPRFIGLRGAAQDLRKATDAFAVTYTKIGGQAGKNYTFDHTAYVFLVDPSGQLRLKVPHGQSAEALTTLIQEILD